VGILGPLSPAGRRLREVLQERAFPITELKLFQASGSNEATLTEFEGEILVTQALDPDLFPRLDVLFLAEPAPGVVLERARREGVPTLILEGDDEAPLMTPRLNQRSVPEPTFLKMPRPAALVLGSVLAAVAHKFHLRRASATVLAPAAERGPAAMEELQQQTINLLSFRPPPTAVFGDQLAFNLLPGGAGDDGDAEIVSRQAAAVAELTAPVAVNLVWAPVFASYAVSMWLDLAEEPPPAEVEKALASSRFLKLQRPGKRSKQLSPLSAGGLEGVQVGPVRAQAGGYWIWIAADLQAVHPADQAVRWVEKHLLAPARPR
jgi:aspartate-semialdehyde dehydrogenase